MTTFTINTAKKKGGDGTDPDQSAKLNQMSGELNCTSTSTNHPREERRREKRGGQELIMHRLSLAGILLLFGATWKLARMLFSIMPNRDSRQQEGRGEKEKAEAKFTVTNAAVISSIPGQPRVSNNVGIFRSGAANHTM